MPITICLDKLLLNASAESQNGIVFIYPNDRSVRISYAQLLEDARNVLGGLRHAGLQPGDELVIQIDDNLSFLRIFWACILGKIIPVPLSTGVQQDQKRKLLKVWHYLRNPYLVCEEQQLIRLQELEDGENEENSLFPIWEKLISITDLLNSKTPGDLPLIEASDIAFIQFSSGSTGDPKGVCLTHANLLANVADIETGMELDPWDILLSWMPLTHDMGMIAFHLVALSAKAEAVIIPTSLFIRHPLLWMNCVATYRASILFSPNFGLQYYLNALSRRPPAGLDISCIRSIITGAETISPELCENFEKTLKPYGLRDSVFLSAYGLAEASVMVTGMLFGDTLSALYLDRRSLNVGNRAEILEKGASGAVPFVKLGYPGTYCELRICDDRDQLLPEGFIGHIQVKGYNVTSGYYNNPEATEKIFTRDKWLKTGDLGLLMGGQLIMTGRLKNIIIINGQNYYPDDIERVIINAGIAQLGKVVSCSIRNEEKDEEELHIFLLHKDDEEELVKVRKAIRDVVFREIGIMVAGVTGVAKIPKTTSGKVQHFKLVQDFLEKKNRPLAAQLSSAPQAMAETPGGSLEDMLAGVVKDILGREDIDRHTNLLKAGLNSVMVMQMAGRISQTLGRDIPLEVFFDYPDIAAMARYIRDNQGEAILQLPFAAGEPALPAPPSSAQRRIWAELQLNPGSTAYHDPVLHRIRGKFDAQRFLQAFTGSVAGHEILRTTYHPGDNGPVQRIHLFNQSLYSIQETDLSGHENPEAGAARLIEEILRQPFDLEKLPLFRLAAIRLAEDEYLLLVVLHHIITDGWSLEILFTETARRYNSYDPPAADAGIRQYRDYCHWQQQLPDMPHYQVHRNYWKNQLTTVPAPLDFSLQQHQADAYRHGPAGLHLHHFSNKAWLALEKLAGEHNVTHFNLVLSLLAVLGYRCTGQREMVIGFDTSGRLMKDMEQMMGYTLNTLLLTASTDPSERFAELLARVRQSLTGAMAHQLYPFENMVNDLALTGGRLGKPVFNTLVLYQNFYHQTGGFRLNDCLAEKETICPAHCFTDLVFEFEENTSGLQLKLMYNQLKFEAAEIGRLALHLEQLLLAVQNSPDTPLARLPLLNSAEKQQLIRLGSGSADFAPEHLAVHELFERSARAFPHQPALSCDGRILTYAELNRRSNALAFYLNHTYAIAPGDCIGFLLNRSEWMVMAVLSILKSGAAYLGLDMETPVERCAHLAADSQMKCLLVHRGGAVEWPEHFGRDFFVEIETDRAGDTEWENPGLSCQPDQPAYLIYTSGSTGMPKGVVITHGAISDYAQYFAGYFRLTGADVVIQQSSPAFDTMAEEIFPALARGAALEIAPLGSRDPEALMDLIGRSGATLLSTTPLALQEINALADERLKSLRIIISGGEVLYPAQVDRLFKFAKIFNTYGPSEATVCIAYHQINNLNDASLLGKPVGGKNLYILDEAEQLALPGRTGELWVEGGISAGYLNQPELTAEKFRVLPGISSHTLYRTGDICRWTETGELAFVGRTDNQLKIRGHRVEPEEIEKRLLLHPAVQSAAVLPSAGFNSLLAYIVPQGEWEEKKLRHWLSQWFPPYLLPASIRGLEKMPLTVTGKINRTALQEMQAQTETAVAGEKKTISPLQEKLKEILLRLLPLQEPGPDDNFFEKGFNSIMATRLAGHLQKELNLAVKPADIFLHPTLGLLAERLEEMAPYQFRSIEKQAPAGYSPLSSAQERLWFIHRLDPRSYAYNECNVYRVNGNLDQERVKACFTRLVERHDSLRTAFVEKDGIPWQMICAPSAAPVPFTYTDLAAAAEPGLQAWQEMESAFRQVFQLSAGFLFRISLIRVGEEEFLLGIVTHHIVTDDWSARILMREFKLLYEAGENQAGVILPELPLHYTDYVHWANGRIHDAEMDRQRQFWLNCFAGEIPVLELPLDFPRPARKGCDAGTHYCMIGREELASIRAHCSGNRISLFMYLFSAVSLWLYKFTGQNDLVIGTPVAGRDHPDLEGLTGFFVNTLPVRIRLNEQEDITRFTQRVKETCLAAFAHQLYPFDQLVQEVQTARNLSRSPLFDVLMNLSTETDAGSGNLQFTRAERPFSGSKCDLAIYFEEKPDSLSFMVEYDRQLFEAESISHLSDHLVRILSLMPQQPLAALYELDCLTPRDRVFFEAHYEVKADCPSENACELFVRQAKESPESPCVSCEDRNYTYREIDEWSTQLAIRLQSELGWKAGAIACLLLDRTELIIVAILAVWKAGGIYLPVDPEFPKERIGYILKDSAACLLITDEKYQAKALSPEAGFESRTVLLNAQPEEIRAGVLEKVSAEKYAYIIYTSGSTGEPKGVLVYHRSLTNVLQYLRDHPGCGPGDTYLSLSSYTFDISVSEFFLPLVSGARLVMATREQVMDMKLLIRLFSTHKPSLAQATPALWNALVASGFEGSSRLRLITCGEPLQEDLKLKLLSRTGELWNIYGPTETTIFSTGKKISSPDERVTIGYPVNNTRIYIVDRFGRLAPPGAYGEMMIGGMGLSAGYLNKQELTDSRFLKAVHGVDERVYATGDFCRWLPDGCIEYRGRMDNQVKLRGFRIELGEIESLMLSHPDVYSAAVDMQREGGENKAVVAFVVFNTADRESGSESLRNYLKSFLPQYMIPSHIISLPALPLTGSGKVDKKKLWLVAGEEMHQGAKKHLPAETGMEKMLAEIWEEILGRRNIGMNDDFFELGGHSLSANRLISRIQNKLGIEISLADVFMRPTIRQLAGFISELEASQYDYIELT